MVAKTSKDPPQDTREENPVEDVNSLIREVRYLPWFEGNIPGHTALLHDALTRENPNLEVLRDNHHGARALERTPLLFKEYYDSVGNPKDEVLKDAKADIEAIIEANLSPEVRTQIEDLKLLASEVFGEVAADGLLPYFNQNQFVARLAETKFGIHGQFDKLNDGSGAAFAFPDKNEIGSIGLSNMLRPKSFIHEVAHIAIEANTPGYVTLYDCCQSIGEATVQHLADRGYQFFRKKAFKNKEEGVYIPFAPPERKNGMRKAKFGRDDEKGVYEEDRRILYELCEGDIELLDFMNALSDPSFASTGTLIEKLMKQFGDLPAYFGQIYEYDSPLSVIQTHIDGPNAEVICGGLKERHERAEFVLKQIWRYKNKRDLEQAWSARTAHKKAYANARRAATRVHSSYFS